MQEEQKVGQASVKENSLDIKLFFSVLTGGKEGANARLLSVIAGLTFGICAYFLGKCGMMFDTFPLGVALLCAADKRIPYILTGLCLSAAGTGANETVFVITYIVTTAVRVFVRLAVDVGSKNEAKTEILPKTAQTYATSLREWYIRLFTENIYLRMTSSCLAAFCLSLYAIIAGGFRYYDLFGAFFAMTLAPVATFLYATCFDAEQKGSRIRDIGILALLASSVYALRGAMLFGVYVSAFVAFFAMLCVGRRKGMLYGCICGGVLGLAFSPVYAPLFILGAASAGVLWNISAVAASTAACIVGMIWGVYVNGTAALSQLLPALLCGAMLFGAADRLSLITGNPELIRENKEDKRSLELLLREQMNKSDEACFTRLSSMFSELAESFFNISDRLRRPGVLDLRRMCDGVFDRYCPQCPKHDICWGVEYSSTLDVLNRLTGDLHMKAKAEPVAVPDYLRTRCGALPQIITEINENCSKLTEHALMCDRTGVFALDYDGISRILSDALSLGREDYIIDEDTADAVAAMLKKLRFSFSGVIAFGGRRKSIAIRGLDASRAKINVRELREKLEEAAGVPLGEPVFTPDGSRLDVSISSRRKYRISQHGAQLTAQAATDKNNVCGDTFASFESCSDYGYMLVSDGMGSGREAAFTSRICTMFLERMLTAGNRSETSLRLLNSFMSEKDGGARYENSATVDLLEFDLLNGSMSLLKSGAAPTYVRRDGNCFRLQSKTVPVGILDTPDVRRLRFEAQEGDMIVMVSDGVTQSREDCAWLISMLSQPVEDDCSVLSKRIAERARSEGSDDDITVVIVRVDKA